MIKDIRKSLKILLILITLDLTTTIFGVEVLSINEFNPLGYLNVLIVNALMILGLALILIFVKDFSTPSKKLDYFLFVALIFCVLFRLIIVLNNLLLITII